MMRGSRATLVAIVASLCLFLVGLASAGQTPVGPHETVMVGQNPDGSCHTLTCRHVNSNGRPSALHWEVLDDQGGVYTIDTEPGEEFVLHCDWQTVVATNISEWVASAYTNFGPP